MTSRRSPSRSFDASIVQTWENKCKRGFVLDYETLKCVSATSARGKELMSAERRAKTVLASGKTTKQKLFGVLKVAGALTGGTVAAYLAYLASSSATSAAFVRLLRSASAQASVDIPKIVKAAEAAPKKLEVVVAANDTTKTMLRTTMRALVGAGFAGMIFGKMRGGGGGPVTTRSSPVARLGDSPLDNPFATPAAIRNSPRSSPRSSSPATIAYIPESPPQQVRQRRGNRSSAVGAGWAPQSPPVIVNSGHFVAARTPSPTAFERFARIDRNARARYPITNGIQYTM